MVEFIHSPKPDFLVSTTSNEILSWMIEIWMKTHLVIIVNTTLRIYKQPKNSQGMSNNVGFTLIFFYTKPQLVVKEWVSPQESFLTLVQIVELRRTCEGLTLVP